MHVIMAMIMLHYMTQQPSTVHYYALVVTHCINKTSSEMGYLR